jgi:hypothetical protein
MPKAAVLAATLLAATASNGSAYNQDTHTLLVDYAWRVMLAIDAVGSNDQAAREIFPTLSVPPGFADSVHKAVKGIRGLKAELPAPKSRLCLEQDSHGLPNWPDSDDMQNVTLRGVRNPIGVDYEKGNDCGIWYSWSPGTAYMGVVAVDDDHHYLDHTGTVLGYWAQDPDNYDSDYHVGIKPTNLGTVSLIEDGLAAAGALPAATVWVPVKCAWKCVKSVVSFSPSDCADCCKQAIEDGVNVVHDTIDGIDSVIPVIGAVRKDAGIGHHINVVHGKSDYDDVSGLLTVNAGPYGVPGAVELISIWLAIDFGLTVRYDDSDATRNYEVQGAHDGSPNSRHRGAADWEMLPFPFLPMTPVDNLGWYGDTQFNKGGGKNNKYLGFALHAIADASVPMHATGAFGWGHRPYEDAVTALHPELLLTAAKETEPARLKTILLPRAQAYYQIISDWRVMNPGRDREVPIRALINAVAQKTWSISRGNMSVFNDPMSLLYAAPGGEDASTVLYLGQRAIMQQLVDEAVAASIAYLVAVGEKL